MKKQKNLAGIYFLLLAVGVILYIIISNMDANVDTTYTDDTLKKALKESRVFEVNVQQNYEIPTGKIKIYFTDGSEVAYYSTDVNETIKMVKDTADKKVALNISDVKRPSWLEKALPYIFALIMVMFALSILGGQASKSGGQGGILTFGKSRAKKDEVTNVSFKDVAGLDEEKQELKEIVEFLKNPKRFSAMGARIPKGLILVGPPGTGKTLLAKAVSGEAGVPFFSISGSDFVEMFVGVGAARVRDLFADAKRNAPCIVFIDEIDAVARRRGTGLGGGHDEKEQTLNQLLVEMDGFGNNSGIIVMAATNRVDILDPAILRPGRFDRKVSVGRPDVKGREEILRVHAANKHIGDDVDMKEIARTTAGFAGADLENLLNEAAINAVIENRQFITKADVDKSFIKVGIGTEKRSRLVPDSEKRITAYHEAGHAILFHELSEMDPVFTVSIVPTGDSAAGYTMPLPGNDNRHVTKTKMLQHIMVDLGGRIAEELVFDDITTGASQDIKMASKTARDMVVKYGFSPKLGLINYEANDDEQVFLGKELGHERFYGEKVAADIDSEVKRIIDECYEKAKEIIVSKRDILDKSAALLLEKEKITGAEFDALFT